MQQAVAYHEQDLVLVVDVAVGQLAGDQLEHHDAKGVHVRLERVGIGILHSYYFRRHPKNRSRWLIELLTTTPSDLDSGETEIADLDRQVLVKEYV